MINLDVMIRIIGSAVFGTGVYCLVSWWWRWRNLLPRFEPGTFLRNQMNQEILVVLQDTGTVIYCSDTICPGRPSPGGRLLFHRGGKKYVWDGCKCWQKMDEFEAKLMLVGSGNE